MQALKPNVPIQFQGERRWRTTFPTVSRTNDEGAFFIHLLLLF